ncbi:MAG: ROK family protein [Lachnospiraceae bacterium]|nr:ROK family protein [Lachnospiraceae bacterium]
MDKIISTTAQVKENNKELIKKAIIELKQATKIMVAKKTGLSVATCNTLLNELARSEEIVEVKLEKKASCAGRPSKTFRINDDFHLTCCISFLKDATGFSIHYEIIDLLGNILSEKMLSEAEITYEKIYHLLQSIILEYSNLRIISISIPGMKDEDNKIVTCSIPSLIGINLVQSIEDDFGIPAMIDNDMNLIALGLYKEKKNLSSTTVISLSFENGKCTGAGIIINGSIIHGKNNHAGDTTILNLPVESPRGLFHSIPKINMEDSIAKVISIFIYLFNPDIIMLTGQSMNITLIGPVSDLCKRSVGEARMPEIVYAQDTSSYLFTGLTEVTLS